MRARRSFDIAGSRLSLSYAGRSLELADIRERVAASVPVYLGPNSCSGTMF